LRPVVLLMLLASVLFVLDGILDGVYPGGPAWFTGKYNNLAEIAYIFAIVNTAVAYLVARGSERSLMARIGLSAFFLIERPLTAFILGPKELPAVVVHLATALVELVILVTALLFVIERSFSPFALRVVDPLALVLHELAAFVALALALACASAIRGQRANAEGGVASLEAA